MIELLNTGAYLVNGIDIIPDTEEGRAELKARTGAVPCPADAAKETIAYGILKDHNVSGNMENLQIKFDKLTSHDITFVGIIQTARASGLEKFPVPYVLTNCHNSLCAVWHVQPSASMTMLRLPRLIIGSMAMHRPLRITGPVPRRP